jgi:large exoprotein involved in heme utilization and adhesion
LNTNNLSLADMSVVQTSTFGPGPSGSITVQGLGGSGTMAHTVLLAGGSSLSSSSLGNDEGEGGAAGNILVETQTLSLSGGSQITTSSIFSPGDAGTITIYAGEKVQLSQGILTSRSESNIPDEFVNDYVIGNAGSIIVSAPSVTLKNHSLIASTTDSRYTRDPSKGNAGSVTVNATNLSLTEGSQLTSSSIIGESGQSPVGNAGSVTAQVLASPASSVLISGPGSGLFTETQGTGAGGNIFVDANSVTLTNGATVSASSTGQIENPGAAGSIDITATNGFTMQNSAITTQAGQGASGGDIKVTTAPSATVLLENSRISASVADGPGGGGNISIDPQYVILQNSQILAQAAQGQGGAITITANLFLPDATSIVNADSGSGVNGTVTIQSPNAPASGKIQPLGKTPLLATTLLNQPCAALAGGEFSSFTVAGRDSLPTEPGSWLASPLYAAGVGEGRGGKAEGVKAEGERPDIPILSLRQIAPAGFLTQAFAVDWSAGCQS